MVLSAVGHILTNNLSTTKVIKTYIHMMCQGLLVRI